MWTMITNLLCIIYKYYNVNNVYSAFQNNFTLPSIDDYIMITLLNFKQNMTPINTFNPTNKINTVTGFYNENWQIDLYGKNANIASTLLLTYLNSNNASNFLLKYNSGIGKVQNVKNLTTYNDRNQFMFRYVINFEVLQTNNIALPTNGIALKDITINLQKEY